MATNMIFHFSSCDLENGYIATIGLQNNSYNQNSNQMQIDVVDYNNNHVETNTGSASNYLPACFTNLLHAYNTNSLPSAQNNIAYSHPVSSARIQKQGQYFFLTIYGVGSLPSGKTLFKPSYTFPYAATETTYIDNYNYSFYNILCGCAYYAPNLAPQFSNYWITANNNLPQFYKQASNCQEANIISVQGGVVNVIASVCNGYSSSGILLRVPYAFDAFTGSNLTASTVTLDTVAGNIFFNNVVVLSTKQNNVNSSDVTGNAFYLDNFAVCSIYQQVQNNPLFQTGSYSLLPAGNCTLSYLNPYFPLLGGVNNYAIGQTYAFLCPLSSFGYYLYNSRTPNSGISIGLVSSTFIQNVLFSGSVASNFILQGQDAATSFPQELSTISFSYPANTPSFQMGGNTAYDNGILQVANTPQGIMCQTGQITVNPYAIYCINKNGFYYQGKPGSNAFNQYTTGLTFIASQYKIFMYGETYTYIMQIPVNRIFPAQQSANMTIAGKLVYDASPIFQIRK